MTDEEKGNAAGENSKSWRRNAVDSTWTPGLESRALRPHAYSIECLKFRYGNGRDDAQTWVLNGVSFEVAEGEILGIIGPNGCGKTTLLKLLTRILRPQGGAIRLFKREISQISQDMIARTAALVPQDSQQIFPYTIAEMVLMGRFPHRRRGGLVLGLDWEEPHDLEIADQAMNEMDIAHLSHRLIGDVSGGERQRAVIARALTQQPQVLLLDEPTAFLDLHHQLDICRTLRRLNEERGLTVMLVSHDLNLASQYCDRLLLLKEGVVYRLGTPEEVMKPDVLESVYRCQVLVDRHPVSGLPRVTLPGRAARSR
ncbi:MAG: ABC transporter ATP-binding protein [Nitrospiraceae bacterium]